MGIKQSNLEKMAHKVMFDIGEDTELDDSILKTPKTGTQIPRSSKPTKNVEVEKIKNNAFNYFGMDCDEEYLELKRLIKKDGITVPIITLPEDENGEYTILSGHRRLKAAKELGIKKVTIQIKSGLDDPASQIAYIARSNGGTRQKQPFDMTREIKQYAIVSGITEFNAEEKEKIINDFEISQSAYYNYMSLINLPDKILEYGSNKYITRNDGIFLSTLMKDPNGDEVIEDIIIKIDKIIANCKSEKKISSETKMLIENIKKKREIALKTKETREIHIGNKSPNLSKTISKMHKLINPTLLEQEFQLPKQDKKKSEVIQMISESIEVLEELKKKIQ